MASAHTAAAVPPLIIPPNSLSLPPPSDQQRGLCTIMLFMSMSLGSVHELNYCIHARICKASCSLPMGGAHCAGAGRPYLLCPLGAALQDGGPAPPHRHRPADRDLQRPTAVMAEGADAARSPPQRAVRPQSVVPRAGAGARTLASLRDVAALTREPARGARHRRQPRPRYSWPSQPMPAPRGASQRRRQVGAAV
jgi:hypothetical protein